MKTVTKKFYEDPGHGWLAVKVQELVDLGLVTSITGYSYIKGKTAYLEEDYDAPQYIQAMEKIKGVKVEIGVRRHRNYSHPIRSYPMYTVAKAGAALIGDQK